MSGHETLDAAKLLVDAGLQPLLAALGDVVYVVTADSVVSACVDNRGTRIDEGSTRAVGQPASLLVHPDDAAALDSVLSTRGGTVQVRRADGQGWQAAAARVSQVGDHLVLALSDDTGQQSESLETLRAEMQRMRVVMAHGREGYAVVSVDGTFRWLGSVPGEWGIDTARGIGTLLFDRVHPADQARTRRAFARVAAGELGASETVELRWQAPSCQWRHVAATATNRVSDPDVGGLVLNVRDVTDQKSAEREVARREAMFGALLSHSHDLVLVYGTDGAVEYQSSSVQSVLGYLPDDHRMGNATHPDDCERVRQVFGRVTTEPRSSSDVEYRLRTADGTYRWMYARLTNMTHDPAVRGIVMASRDITNRRRQEILLDGQTKALVAAAAGEPLVDVLSLLCQAAEDYLSESEPVAVGVALPQHATDDVLPIGGSNLLRLLHAEGVLPRTCVDDVLAHDGARVWEVAEHPVLGAAADTLAERGVRGLWTSPLHGPHGEVLCVAIALLSQPRPPRRHEQQMIERMTELAWLLLSREIAEQDLRASEARFRSAFDNTGVPSAILSPNGRFEDVNDAMCALFGFGRDELLGNTFHWLMLPGQTDHWSTEIPAVGDAYPTVELRVRHSDGGPLQVVVHAAVLRDEHGRVRNVVAHYLDVTEQRAGEDEVRLLNELLSQRVTELYNAKERLTQSFREVTEAREDERRQLSLALHDDTVQRLVAALWSLDDLDLPEEDPAVTQVAGHLRSSVDSVRRMIFELRPQILDAQGLAAAVEQELGALEDTSGITSTLEVDLPVRPPAEVESLAYRTVREALQNVRKHAQASAVHVRLRVDGDALVVAVVDDGVGFDQQLAHKRREAGHYGVMSIQESTVLAGGEVYLGNRRDGVRGTELDMRLPVCRPQSQPAAGAWGEATLSAAEIIARAIEGDRRAA